jgi:hypothetical protein
VDIRINVNNPALFIRRMTVILGVFLVLFFIVSLVFFLAIDQWQRRVLFFPEVNSKKFVSEIRYLPEAGRDAGNIRLLLEDILLGPSNYGNALVLPDKTRLLSMMLEDNILYVGFSKGIYQLDSDLFEPREMLQAVADSVFFNFPGVKKVYFFIEDQNNEGQELSDLPLLHLVDRKMDFAKMLIPHLGDLSDTMRFLSANPLTPRSGLERNIFAFQNGAQWDERLLK